MNGAEPTMAELGGRREGVGDASKERVGETTMLMIVAIVVEWCCSVIREFAVERDYQEDDED